MEPDTGWSDMAPFWSPSRKLFKINYCDTKDLSLPASSFPDVTDYPDFKSYQAAVISYLNFYSGNWILPNLVSLFFRRPPAGNVQISISEYLSKVELPHENLHLVTDKCLKGVLIDREEILPGKCMKRYPMKMKQLWNNSREWLAQCIPQPPYPEMYDTFDSFEQASGNWMEEAGNAKYMLEHPRQFKERIDHLSDIETKPRRASIVYTKDIAHNRRRRRLSMHEKRSVLQKRDWLTEVQLKFRCHEAYESPKIQENLRNLMRHCAPVFDCSSVISDMEASTIEDKRPVAVIRELMANGWTGAPLGNLSAVAGTLLTVNEQNPRVYSANIHMKNNLANEIRKAAVSRAFPVHYALYQAISSDLEGNIERIINWFSGDIGIIETVTFVFSEFASDTAIRVPETCLEELDRISGNMERTIVDHAHNVVFYYEYMKIWLKIFEKNGELKTRINLYKKKALEQISLLFRQFSGQISRMLMRLDLSGLTASMFEIMISSNVPEIQKFIYQCSNDLFVVFNRIGTDAPEKLNAIVYQMQMNTETSSFMFETFCMFAEHPEIGAFSQAFVGFLKLLLNMNINRVKISVSWLSPFFLHLLNNNYGTLMLSFTKFLTNVDREEVDKFVLEFLVLIYDRIIQGKKLHPDMLVACSVLLKTHVSQSFVAKIYNSFVDVFNLMTGGDENVSFAAWNMVESFALYHYNYFAKALKKNAEFNAAFAETLKKISPNSCIVLFSIIRMLFKMSMSKKKPGKVKKKSKNAKVKLLSRLSKVIVRNNVDLVKKSQWALDFLSGSDQQHAMSVIDGLLESLNKHPYGKWFAICK